MPKCISGCFYQVSVHTGNHVGVSNRSWKYLRFQRRLSLQELNRVLPSVLSVGIAKCSWVRWLLQGVRGGSLLNVL